MPLPPGTLNQALDQLPQLLLNLGRLQQDRRDEEMRREIQQASQVFEAKVLERRIAAEKEMVQFRAGMEPPSEPRIIEDVAGRKRFAPGEGRPGELVFPEAEAPARGPSASDVAFARRRMEKYQGDIAEVTSYIDEMRQRLKLAPGEQPKTPSGILGIGVAKEQRDLDNWNKLQKDLTRAKASLDNLLKKSQERGIDLEFGAPAPLPSPEQIKNMSEEEILQMMLKVTGE